MVVQYDANFGALAGLGSEAEAGADLGGALAHPLDAKTVHLLLSGDPAAIVADGEGEAARLAPQAESGAAGIGMAGDILEGFLGDAVQVLLEVGG